MAIERVLLQFEKSGKALVGEYRLEGMEIAELQQLFGESSDDPMYHSYDVTAAQAGRLERSTGVHIDLDSYDYFIQAYSVDEPATGMRKAKIRRKKWLIAPVLVALALPLGYVALRVSRKPKCFSEAHRS
jgi:hypothetical protein